MNKSKKIYFLFLFVIFFAAGWTSIPKSEYPAEIQRVYAVSFGQAWDAVVEIIKKSRGAIITQDKSSGIVVFSIQDNEIESAVYVNIYIKSLSTTNTTSVYLIPKIKKGLYSGKVDGDFFNELEKTLERR